MDRAALAQIKPGDLNDAELAAYLARLRALTDAGAQRLDGLTR